MKNTIKVFGNLFAIALIAIIGFTTTACPPEQPAPGETITISEILGVTAPVAGERPVSQITPNEQYSGDVSWGTGGAIFEDLKVYTATIRLSVKEGWTTKGLPEDFFTVAGATETKYTAGSYVITAVFPETGITTLSSIAEFATWLKNKRDNNTAETPYKVKLNIDSLGGDSTTEGSVGNELRKYIDWFSGYKYVILDLSDSTMTSIESSAFYGCSYLVEVIIGDSVNEIENSAFYYCERLASVTIPDSVTKIEKQTFQDCTSLTSITIGNGVKNIESWAFQGCIGLTSVTFATGSNISNDNFKGSAFPERNGLCGDTLKTAYSTGKAGTYTRPANGSTWTKQP